MTISRLLLFFAAVCLLSSCGIKSAPTPKDALNIPLATSMSLSMKEGSIVIANNDTMFNVLVERAVDDDTLFRNRMFTRLTMIRPQDEFADEDVRDGTRYVYRFKNYSREYNTYSLPTTKSIRYILPVQLERVHIDQYVEYACVNTHLSEAVDYARVMVNGRETGRISESGVSCFDMPNMKAIQVMIIPYDKSGNPGTPYSETLERNEELVLLPPSNVIVRRAEGKIILSWDESKNIDSYAVYLSGSYGVSLLAKTDITLYQHNIPNDNVCVSFELSVLRGEQESDRVKITSCP